MVQIDSLNIDAAESIRQAVEFQTRLPRLAAAEASFLRDSGRAPRRRRHPAAGVRRGARGGRARRSRSAISPGTGSTRGIATTRRADLATRHRAAYRTRHARPAAADVPAASKGSSRHARHPVHRAAVAARRQTKCARRSGCRREPRGKPLVLMSFGGYGVAGLDSRRARRSDGLHDSRRPICRRAANTLDQAGAGRALHLRAASCTTAAALRRPRPRRRRRRRRSPATASSAKRSPTTPPCSTLARPTSSNTTCWSERCRDTCARSSSSRTDLLTGTGAPRSKRLLPSRRRRRNPH